MPGRLGRSLQPGQLVVDGLVGRDVRAAHTVVERVEIALEQALGHLELRGALILRAYAPEFSGIWANTLNK